LLTAFGFIMHMIMVMDVRAIDAIAILIAVLPGVTFVSIALSTTSRQGDN
jgi:hypothetical protein